jgi:uncharacterized coiled-coil protein SlyX
MNELEKALLERLTEVQSSYEQELSELKNSFAELQRFCEALQRSFNALLDSFESEKENNASTRALISRLIKTLESTKKR